MPYRYEVAELREAMFGGNVSGEELERMLNEHAQHGWRLTTVTSANVQCRIGPDGVDGSLATFEREV